MKTSALPARLLATLTAGLLLASTALLHAREGEGGDDRGGGGGGQGSEVEFLGRVEALPAGGAVAGSWRVNGVVLLVDSATVIKQENGRIAVGSLVEVKAARQTDGSFKATKIEDEDARREDFGEAEFTGVVTALPPAAANFVGTWRVGERAVVVTSATVLNTARAALAVSVKVEIKGRVLSDGSVQAALVKTEDAGFEAEDRRFSGVIQALPAGGLLGVWRVSGFNVIVNAGTKIEAEGGALQVGQSVSIEGVQQPDASIVASEINRARAAFGDAAAEVTLVGRIEHLPETGNRVGNWTVDGVIVTISPESVFDLASGRKAKKAHEGDEVEVHGRRQPDGSILATSGVLEIEGRETNRHFLKYAGLVANYQPVTATRPGSIILAGGQVLRFDDRTKFDDTPTIGSTISVKATSGRDGTDDAHKVKVK